MTKQKDHYLNQIVISLIGETLDFTILIVTVKVRIGLTVTKQKDHYLNQIVISLIGETLDFTILIVPEGAVIL